MPGHGPRFVELQEYSASRENGRHVQLLSLLQDRTEDTTSYNPATSVSDSSPVRGDAGQEALIVRAGDLEVGVEAEVGDDEVPCGGLPRARGEVVGGRQDSHAGFHGRHDHGEEATEHIAWSRRAVEAP